MLALGILSAGALAAPSQTFTPESDGPQSANIPYVAWVGEHLRLVMCDPHVETSEAGGQHANFRLEDWSGKPEAAEIPELESGTQAFFAPSAGSPQAESGDGCVKVDYKSLAPGLARIRGVVSNASGTIVYSHQFIVIWLTVNKPTMNEAGVERNVPSGENTFQSQVFNQGNLRSYLGDPEGNGEFAPSPFEPSTASNQEKGLIQIKVTGSFPVEPSSLLHNVLPEASYTLPESWPTLADALATSSEELEPAGANPGLWDIHGTPGEGTDPNEFEPLNDPLTASFWRPAFDNYTSGPYATIGPFDPQAPNETLLSDGRLNANDAPMPAIRVDVGIAPNTGGGDLGGVGQIEGASKALIYSHEFNGAANQGGNLYNPYYGAYIPATERPVPQASGIDGPKKGGDFPGFLNGEGPYTFWTSVHNSGERSSESTGCLRRTDDYDSSYYQTPSGILNETFYTDEEGEVYLAYTPGDGFFLNHLPVLENAGEEEAGKIVKNADGGCDLKNIYKDVIGETSISAKAVYPYQTVDFPAESAEAPIVKKVRSYWEKEFFSFPKGPGSNEQNIRIVVAKAQDIDGNPIVGEEVCFHAQQEAGLYGFDNSTNGDRLSDPTEQLGKGTNVYLGGSFVTDAYLEGTNVLCATTNDEGLAAIDVVNSTSPSVDITVRYEEEQIVRDHEVSFAGNIGSVKAEEEKKAAEEKAAEEKKIAEEEKAIAKAEKEAEKKAAEEAAKAKAEAEQKALEAKVARENKTEEERVKREDEAETRQNQKETAKEEREKASAEEIKKGEEERTADEAKESARRTQQESEEKARREAEVKQKEEEVKALAKPLVAPLAGAITGSASGSSTSQTKAHAASKKKAKKTKKHKKKKK